MLNARWFWMLCLAGWLSLTSGEALLGQQPEVMSRPVFTSSTDLQSLSTVYFVDPSEATQDPQKAEEKKEDSQGQEKDKDKQDEKKEDKKEDKKEEKKDEKKDEKKKDDKKDEKKEKKWYEKYTLRGYTQLRFNQDLFTRAGSAPPQYVGDRSIGDDQSFFVRRARLIFASDINEYAALYFQPDFSITTPGSTDQTLFAQIRDLYADLYLDTEKEYRFRVGQSKIPYGWENLQSSSNRVPLDRADSLNSGARNERDLGVMFYWTPKPAQDFFQEVNDQGLKGSGNYGVFGLGVYNGQGGSLLETNDNLHAISRFTLPMKFWGCQMAELGLQGYIGEYTVLSSPIRPLGQGPGTFRPLGAAEGNPGGWNDRRLAVTGVWYPQPLGFQTEWTVGRGPALDATQTQIEDRSLFGGYAMFLYNIKTCNRGQWFPFVRWSYYRGGYKSERNAPYVFINEFEFGTEWQIHKAAELTTSYLITDRTNTNATTPLGVAPYQQFDGHVLRMQLQFNY